MTQNVQGYLFWNDFNGNQFCPWVSNIWKSCCNIWIVLNEREILWFWIVTNAFVVSHISIHLFFILNAYLDIRSSDCKILCKSKSTIFFQCNDYVQICLLHVMYIIGKKWHEQSEHWHKTSPLYQLYWPSQKGTIKRGVFSPEIAISIGRVS